MSKSRQQTKRPYIVWNETKIFWYRSRIYLIENRLFRFGPETALLNQIEMISFDKKCRERTQTCWFHSNWILEHMWNVCSFTFLTLLLSRGGSCKRFTERVHLLGEDKLHFTIHANREHSAHPS
jgi:hypothetical protein